VGFLGPARRRVHDILDARVTKLNAMSSDKRAMALRTIQAVTKPASTGPGRSAFWKASIAHAFGVNQLIRWSQSGIRKRGTMLPPTADSSRIPKLDSI
jgi:hypothetical protein